MKNFFKLDQPYRQPAKIYHQQQMSSPKTKTANSGIKNMLYEKYQVNNPRLDGRVFSSRDKLPSLLAIINKKR